jgi:hypothetical protein
MIEYFFIMFVKAIMITVGIACGVVLSMCFFVAIREIIASIKSKGKEGK